MTQNGGALSLSEQIGRHSKLPDALLAADLDCAWFAVHTRPRHEKKVAGELDWKGIQAFLPMAVTRRQWSDRQRLIHLPLFPGYVFVLLPESLESRVAVLRTNGVVGFVGANGTGTPVSSGEMEAVRKVLQEGLAVDAHPYLRVGQRVRIRGGSLNGVEGILQAKNGDMSLVISVELIQRSLAVRVEGFDIEAL